MAGNLFRNILDVRSVFVFALCAITSIVYVYVSMPTAYVPRARMTDMCRECSILTLLPCPVL